MGQCLDSSQEPAHKAGTIPAHHLAGCHFRSQVLGEHGQNHSKLIPHFKFRFLIRIQWTTLKIDEKSPLRNCRPLYWGLTQNDEGAGLDTAFHAMVTKGKIALVAPAKVTSFGEDGRSIMTNDGRTIEAEAVVLCTGFYSSWNKIFDREFLQIARASSAKTQYREHHRGNRSFTSICSSPDHGRC